YPAQTGFRSARPPPRAPVPPARSPRGRCRLPAARRSCSASSMPPLKGRDARLLEQRPADFVETAQQQLAPVRIGGEPRFKAKVICYHLPLQINLDLAQAGFGAADQIVH